jgi:hypothetical protein
LPVWNRPPTKRTRHYIKLGHASNCDPWDLMGSEIRRGITRNFRASLRSAKINQLSLKSKFRQWFMPMISDGKRD